MDVVKEKKKIEFDTAMLCPALQTPYDNRKGDIEEK
jgi:hypothetical protein